MMICLQSTSARIPLAALCEVGCFIFDSLRFREGRCTHQTKTAWVIASKDRGRLGAQSAEIHELQGTFETCIVATATTILLPSNRKRAALNAATS